MRADDGGQPATTSPSSWASALLKGGKTPCILKRPLNNVAQIAHILGKDGCPSCGNYFYINDEGQIAGGLMPLHNDRDYPGADGLCQNCGTGLRLAVGGRVEQVKRVTP